MVSVDVKPHVSFPRTSMRKNDHHNGDLLIHTINLTDSTAGLMPAQLIFVIVSSTALDMNVYVFCKINKYIKITVLLIIYRETL